MTHEEAERLRLEGNAAFSAGQLERAVSYYDRTVELDPANHAALSNRSLCNLKLGRCEDSLRDATRCVDANPSWPKGHARRAAALQALGRTAEAQAAAEEAVRLDNGATREFTKLLESLRRDQGVGAKRSGAEEARGSDQPEVARDLPLALPGDLSATPQRGWFPGALSQFSFHACARGPAPNLLVLLHGLGDSDSNFLAFGRRLDLPATHVSAPARPSSLPPAPPAPAPQRPRTSPQRGGPARESFDCLSFFLSLTGCLSREPPRAAAAGQARKLNQVQVLALRAPHALPLGLGHAWFPAFEPDGAPLSPASPDPRRARGLARAAELVREALGNCWRRALGSPRGTFLLGFSDGALVALQVTNSSPPPSPLSLPLSPRVACALTPPTGGTFPRPRRRPCPLGHAPPRRPLRPARGRGALGAPHAAPPLPRLARRPRAAARGAARVSGDPRPRHTCQAGTSPPTSPHACTAAQGAARGGWFPRADSFNDNEQEKLNVSISKKRE